MGCDEDVVNEKLPRFEPTDEESKHHEIAQARNETQEMSYLHLLQQVGVSVGS